MHLTPFMIIFVSDIGTFKHYMLRVGHVLLNLLLLLSNDSNFSE